MDSGDGKVLCWLGREGEVSMIKKSSGPDEVCRRTMMQSPQCSGGPDEVGDDDAVSAGLWNSKEKLGWIILKLFSLLYKALRDSFLPLRTLDKC